MKESNGTGSKFSEAIIETYRLLFHSNSGERVQEVSYPIDRRHIQFHFVLKGSITLNFQNNYRIPLQEEQHIVLFNTTKDLPLTADVSPDSWMLTLLMTLGDFHALFSAQAAHIPALSEHTGEKKYYAQGETSPAMAVVLSQIWGTRLHSSVQEMYYRAKCLELLSLYFDRPEDADVERCPFLADEVAVRKIRSAKEVLIARMLEPPTLNELAREVDLPLKKLKEGFREIYGDSPFGFLLNYKMDYASKLLLREDISVHDLALRLGYSTPSHFITSFKKKFGTTPRKYLQSRSPIAD